MNACFVVTHRQFQNKSNSTIYTLWCLNYRQLKRYEFLRNGSLTSDKIQVSRKELVNMLAENKSDYYKNCIILNAKLINLKAGGYRISVDYDKAVQYDRLINKINLLGDRFPFDVEFNDEGLLKLNRYKNYEYTGKVTIPPIIKAFRPGCFEHCQFTEIEIHNSPDIELSLKCIFQYMEQQSLTIQVEYPERIVKIDRMFECSSNLKSVTFKNLTRANIKQIDNLFYDCQQLKIVNFDDTDRLRPKLLRVETMENSFENCRNLKNIKFIRKYFDLQAVRTMNYTFKNCERITELDLRGLNLSKLVEADGTFYCCKRLENIVYDNTRLVELPELREAAAIFQGCSQIKQFDLSRFKMDKIENLNNAFRYCSNLTDIKFSSGTKEKQAYPNLQSVTEMLSYTAITQIKLQKTVFNLDTSFTRMLADCMYLQGVDIDYKIKNYLDLERFDGLLVRCNNIKHVRFTQQDIKEADNISRGIQRLFFVSMDIKFQRDIAIRELQESGFASGKSIQEIDKYSNAETYPIRGIYFKDELVDMQELLELN